MHFDIVVAGFGLAAHRFVKELRRLGGSQSILIVGDEDQPAYERPPLSKQHLLSDVPPEPKFFESFDALNTNIRLGIRATALDLVNRRLMLGTGDAVEYSQLVLATGCEARQLWLRGLEEPLPVLRRAADASRLADALGHSRSLLIVGAGFLGLEVAAAARYRGLDVDVVEASECCVGRSVSRDLSNWIESLHRRSGVRFHFNTEVLEAQRCGRTIQIRLSNGVEIDAEIALGAVGAKANDTLAKQAGIDCDQGILVDEYGRTSDPHIFAMGDVARFRNFRGLADVRMESWDNATASAKRLASWMTGKTVTVEEPWFWTDQYGRNIQILGLPPRFDDTETIWRSKPCDDSFARFELREGRLVYAEYVDLGRLRRPLTSMMTQAKPAPIEALADPLHSLRQT